MSTVNLEERDPSDVVVEVPRSFDRALFRAYRRGGANLRQRAQLRYVLRSDEVREDLGISLRNMFALELTNMAISAGLIKPTGEDIVQGIYVGDWYSIIELILENLPMIFELVIKLILIFL
jgi:hypothetical protein